MCSVDATELLNKSSAEVKSEHSAHVISSDVLMQRTKHLFNWTKKLVFEDDSSCVTLQKISASVQMFQFPKTKEETLTL